MLLQACGVVIRAIHRHVVSSYVPVIDNYDTEEVSHHLFQILSRMQLQTCGVVICASHRQL